MFNKITKAHRRKGKKEAMLGRSTFAETRIMVVGKARVLSWSLGPLCYYEEGKTFLLGRIFDRQRGESVHEPLGSALSSLGFGLALPTSKSQ